MNDLLNRQIIHYQKALLIKPDNTEIYSKLAQLYYKQGQIDDAFEMYDLLGIRLVKEGRLEEAVSVYRYIIEVKPDAYKAHYSLGEVLQELQQWHEAIYKKLLGSHAEFAKNYWNSQNRRIPNFLIVGIGKGGTTSLYYYLEKHPQILPAIRKEIHFFSENSERGLDWYLSHFPPIPKESNFLTGEATPWYLVSYGAEKKVASIFPNIKIIILLRNPILRAFSQYQMELKFAGEQRSFAEVISSEIEAIKNFSSPGEVDSDYWQTEKGYLLFGLYFYFIEKWMTVFPREQFLILRSEDFYANPAATLTQVFEFLGVPDYSLAEYRNYNPGSYNSISDDLRQTLAEFFRPHNQKLEEYLGMKFNWDE